MYIKACLLHYNTLLQISYHDAICVSHFTYCVTNMYIKVCLLHYNTSLQCANYDLVIKHQFPNVLHNTDNASSMIIIAYNIYIKLYLLCYNTSLQ